jgi:fructokinase
MAHVVTTGELLIDFVATQPGVRLVEAPAFEPAPGGAPANVAVGVARLGMRCSFLGKVGDDPWGQVLVETLTRNGVETRGVVRTSRARTALAFVSLQRDGEPEFLFYRHPSADMLYQPSEVDTTLLTDATVIHFGSISLIHESSRAATLHALARARQAGALIAYDPNLRLPLWTDEEVARTTIRSQWPQAAIIKVNEEELTFLAEDDDIDRAVRSLWHHGLRLLAVTRGAKGCRYYTPTFQGEVPGYAVNTVDTTGAGDGWMAALLASVARHPALLWQHDDLRETLRFANAAGALTTTRRGAIPALPTTNQVRRLMDQEQGR